MFVLAGIIFRFLFIESQNQENYNLDQYKHLYQQSAQYVSSFSRKQKIYAVDIESTYALCLA